MLLKSFLLGVLILFFASDKFDPLYGKFESHKIKFNYVSTAYMRDDRYYINNYIRCNSKEEICLKWPIAEIYLDNIKPLKTENNKEIYVRYPTPCYVATIFLGRSWTEPVENIKCYKDDDPNRNTATSYKTKVNSINEIGESMNIEVTSSLISPLNLATIEFEVKGASLLIEKTSGYQVELDNNKYPEVITQKNIQALFAESKTSSEMKEILIPKNSTKSYYHFQKDSTESSMKVVLKSQGLNMKPDNLLFCLLSDTRYQNVAFLAKAYIKN